MRNLEWPASLAWKRHHRIIELLPDIIHLGICPLSPRKVIWLWVACVLNICHASTTTFSLRGLNYFWWEYVEPCSPKQRIITDSVFFLFKRKGIDQNVCLFRNNMDGCVKSFWFKIKKSKAVVGRVLVTCPIIENCFLYCLGYFSRKTCREPLNSGQRTSPDCHTCNYNHASYAGGFCFLNQVMLAEEA